MKKILSSFIRKRNDKYYVYVEYIDEVGKKKQKSQGSFINKKDADKKLIEVKNSINNDIYALPSNISFTNRCYRYYDSKLGISENTIACAKSIVKKHVEPYWGNMKLSDITVNKYQTFVNYVFQKDLAYRSKRKIMQLCNAVLNEAYRLQEINKRITDFIIFPKNNKTHEEEIYSIGEIKQILNALESESIYFQNTIKLLIYGGLRRGEVLGLTWDCVDFENKTIKIQYNLQYIEGKYIMKQPKSESSIRSITLPDHVFDMLKKEKLRQNKLKLQGLMKEKEYDTVCINSNNNYYNPYNLDITFKRFIKRIGLEFKKLHSLRHSHVSMLVASGVDVKTISERVGHSDISITLKIYAHAFKENDKIAVDKIDNILSQ